MHCPCHLARHTAAWLSALHMHYFYAQFAILIRYDQARSQLHLGKAFLQGNLISKQSAPCVSSSARTASEASASVVRMIVPGGTGMVTPLPLAPCRLLPAPAVPLLALKCTWCLNELRELSESSTCAQTWPPLPPLPPDGPPARHEVVSVLASSQNNLVHCFQHTGAHQRDVRQ